MSIFSQLFKSRSLPVGTIRVHGGIKKKKMANGKWIPVSKEKTSTKKKKTTTKKKKVTKKVTYADLENRIKDYADKICDKFKVPRIPIKFVSSRGGDILSDKSGVYITYRFRGSRIHHPKRIELYDWDIVRDHPSEWIYATAHELAHHILNMKKHSLGHTAAHLKLTNELEALFYKSKVADKAKEMIKEIKKGSLSKSKGFPIGTIRVHGGVKKKKVEGGKWIPVSKDVSKKSKSSVKRKKLTPEQRKKVLKDIDETINNISSKLGMPSFKEAMGKRVKSMPSKKKSNSKTKASVSSKNISSKRKDKVRTNERVTYGDLEDRIRKYVDKLYTKYKVEHIPIYFVPNVKTLKKKWYRVVIGGRYFAYKVRSTNKYYPRKIEIYNWNEMRDYPSRWVSMISHEMAHHILTMKEKDPTHSKRHKELTEELINTFNKSKVVDKAEEMLKKIRKIKKSLSELNNHPFMKHVELVNVDNIWFKRTDDTWDVFYWFENNLSKAYKLQGRMEFQGLPISIENRKGSVRHWYDPMKDEHGTTKMKYPYGYIRLTEGADGEHVDCYIGDNKDSRKVFVVRQVNPNTGKYDEDKVMLGFNNRTEAKKAYLMHYNDPKFFGSIDEYTIDTFKENIKRKKGKISKKGRLNKAVKKYYTKEELKNLGMRWVTIRGSHVLVQGLAEGGYVVVGGAGGKLNHLKIDKILDKEEYAKKQKEKMERRKKQLEALTPEEKKEQLERRKKEVELKRQLRSEYHKKIAEILGVNEKDLKTSLTLDEMDEIERRSREKLQAKKKRLVGKGGDQKELEKEKEKEIKKAVKKKVKDIERKATEVLAKDFMNDNKDPNKKLNTKELLDVEKAKQILIARKQFKKALKEVSKTKLDKQIPLKEGDVFAGDSKHLEQDILEEVKNNMETLKNINLYNTLNAQAQSIQKYINEGSVNSINGVLSEVYGIGAVFNSDVVEQLGIEAIARTVAVKVADDGRTNAVKNALIEYANELREKVVDEALKEYNLRMEKADMLRNLARDSDDGDALLSMASANGHALKQIVQGQRSLGTAIGSLRAVAHLINALEEAPEDRIVVDAGKDLIDARKMARRAGLKRGMYSIKSYKAGRGKRLVIEIPKETVNAFFANNQENRRRERLDDLIKSYKNNTGYKPEGMKESIKLSNAQEAGLHFFRNNKRVLLDFEAGLGKTAVAYAGALEAIKNMGAKKVLIVTPAKLRQQMYSERKTFLDEEHQKLVNAPTSDRKRRLENYNKEGITIIGHDQLRTDADAIKNAGYDMIVVDEIHEMTSPTTESGRYRGMMKLKDIPLKIGMSGTNIKNDKMEVYKKINFIDPDHTLGSMQDFKKRYKGLNQGTGIFTDASNDAFRKEIAKWVYTQKLSLPIKNKVETIRVNLTPEQRRKYAQSEAIYREEKKAGLKGASARRDARNYSIIQNEDSKSNAKISKLVEIIKTKHPNEKAVIHVTGLNAVKRTKERLEKEFGKGTVGVINGSSRPSEVRRIKAEFNDTSKPLRFIIGTKSLEAGHNLQGGGTVTFQLDLPDTYASFEQRNKRIYRRGQDRDVTTYVLSGHNPYDIRKEDILEKKRREMQIIGNPRDIEGMDDDRFLSLLRKYETGESDATK